MSEPNNEPGSDITIALKPQQVAGVLAILVVIILLMRGRRRSKG